LFQSSHCKLTEGEGTDGDGQFKSVIVMELLFI